METLVERLSNGEHRVEIVARPETTLPAFRDCVERGYVHVLFPDTRGGTELGFDVDRATSDLAALTAGASTGTVTIAGALSLDFVDVRCIAAIDLATLKGTGHLVPIEPSTPTAS